RRGPGIEQRRDGVDLCPRQRSRSDHMTTFAFRARLQKAPVANAWVTLAVPVRISSALGVRGRVHVRGTLDGAPFQTTLAPGGDGSHDLVVKRTTLAAAGVAAGDVVDVSFQRTAPPALRVPRDLAAAIQDDTKAKAYWTKIPPSHRRQYVEWIAQPKKPEPRARRIAQAVAKLHEQKPWR